MKKDRFRVIRTTSEQITNILLCLNFRKLERQATDDKSMNKSTFIDVKRNEFWIVDEESLNQSIDFVKDFYGQKTIELKLEFS